MTTTTKTSPRIQYLPDLTPVITWLENGCDPLEAAKELRLLQEKQPAFSSPAQHKLHRFLVDGYSIVGHALTNHKTSRHAWIDRHGLVLWPNTEDDYRTNHNLATKIKDHVDDLANLAAILKEHNR